LYIPILSFGEGKGDGKDLPIQGEKKEGGDFTLQEED